MRERHLGWLCFVAACAAMALCIGTPLMAAQASKPSDTVNLDLKDTDVKSAIEVLFRNTGKNFSIDSNVHGIIATLSIKDVPFDVALKSLAKSSGLVYRQDGGVYIISMKPDVSMMVNNLPPPQIDSIPVDSPTTEPEIRIEKISLNNVGASEILAMLTGSSRDYGGYGLGYGSTGGSRFGGMNSGMGYGNNYGNNSYGNGYGNGYGMNSGYGNGYGNNGYGMNSGYGNNGYNNGYGSRINGYSNSNGVSTVGGYTTGSYSRGW